MQIFSPDPLNAGMFVSYTYTETWTETKTDNKKSPAIIRVKCAYCRSDYADYRECCPNCSATEIMKT